MLPINGLLSAANNVPSMFDFIVQMLFFSIDSGQLWKVESGKWKTPERTL